MPRKLKVFQARLGFHDTVVAAPSRTAALRAWDVHQNLFEQGEAAETADASAIKAALAHPGVPLMRPAGTQQSFTLKGGKLPRAAKDAASRPRPAAKSARAKAEPAKKAPPRAKPRPPSRKDLAAAEAALEKLKAHQAREDAALEKEFETRRSALMDSHMAQLKDASEALTQARRAYRKAGGED